MGSRSWRTALARFHSERTSGNGTAHQIRQRPHEAGVIRILLRCGNGSAVVVAGSDARNVRAVQTDVGKLAIAERRQFGDIALVAPESLDHADEREQHGSLLVVRFSSWWERHRGNSYR